MILVPFLILHHYLAIPVYCCLSLAVMNCQKHPPLPFRRIKQIDYLRKSQKRSDPIPKNDRNFDRPALIGAPGSSPAPMRSAIAISSGVIFLLVSCLTMAGIKILRSCGVKMRSLFHPVQVTRLRMYFSVSFSTGGAYLYIILDIVLYPFPI